MAPRLKQVIHEIHRRSLWQVTTIYVGASWFVLEVTDQVIERFLLPEWVYGGAIILLLIGLPIVLATAFVREEASPPLPAEPSAEPAASTATSTSEPRPTDPSRGRAWKLRLLTWPKAILGGVLAFTLLGIISAYIVVRGTARVTEAYGAAGETFGEREWIVVADFEAPADERDIALAAREALTIDLQQSRYVNVFGRSQVAPVLRRMSLPDTVPLDPRLALEVAERQGLAAVLAGRVSRLGNHYQFIARVMQPGSARELIAVRTAAHEDQMIEGVEALSHEVRSRLGEEGDEIRRSRPLPEVTTTSLEALKLYSRAVTALEKERDEIRAVQLCEEAVRLDTAFAMAYRLLSAASFNIGRLTDSRRYATRAYELRDRLTDLERLHVEGLYHNLVTSDHREAAGVYERLLERYPDDHRAVGNLGVALLFVGDLEGAYQASRRSLELAPVSIAFANTIEGAFQTHRWEAADSLIARAEERGFGDQIALYRVGHAFARRDPGRADQLCDSLLALAGDESLSANQRQVCGSIDVARGRLERAVARLETAARHYADTRQSFNLSHSVGALMAAEQLRGRPAAATARLAAMLGRFPGDSLGEQDRFFVLTELRVYAGALGRADLVDRIAAAYPVGPGIVAWERRYGEGMGEATGALARGDPAGALARLNEGTRGDYQPAYWIPERRLLYGLAFDGAGATDSAIAYLEAAVDPGFIATWSATPSQVFLPSVLLRLAELEAARGNEDAAIDHYRRFLDLWSDADPGLRPQVDAAERALARLAGAER